MLVRREVRAQPSSGIEPVRSRYRPQSAYGSVGWNAASETERIRDSRACERPWASVLPDVQQQKLVRVDLDLRRFVGKFDRRSRSRRHPNAPNFAPM